MSEWIPEEAWGEINAEVLEYLVFVVKDEAGESEF